MRFFVLFLVVLLSTFSAYARLGDTYRDSTKRFGKALDYFKDKYAEVGLFEYKGFAIFVIYRNGRSIEESYMKLAPGIKTKITRQKVFPIHILNQPENLLPLKEKTRDMLRSANLQAKWSLGDKITLNGIEEMTAVKGDKKVSGDYYIARKVLVIKNENPPPALKAPKSEVEMAKSLCLPLGSDFNDYVNKLDLPFKITAPQSSIFWEGNVIAKVFFKNKEMEKFIKGKIYYETARLKNMQGGTSRGVTYQIINSYFVNKNIHRFDELINHHKIYAATDAEEKVLIKHILAESELLIAILSEKTTIPNNIINILLINSTGTKWTLMESEGLGYTRYSTWKDGRRIYGTYNIVQKKLRIELGSGPEDYKPEVIKKLKEKAEVDALKNF